MKEVDVPIPCIRALEFDCPQICTLLPFSASSFWEAVYNLQIKPEELRVKLIEKSEFEDSVDLRELAEQALRLSGRIYLCRSYLEGC